MTCSENEPWRIYPLLTNLEIEAMHKAASAQVSVACNEYHAHNANCLSGPKQAIDICKLCETILAERQRVAEVVAEQNNPAMIYFEGMGYGSKIPFNVVPVDWLTFRFTRTEFEPGTQVAAAYRLESDIKEPMDEHRLAVMLGYWNDRPESQLWLFQSPNHKEAGVLLLENGRITQIWHWK
jgi:hypothetical protein